MAAVGGNQQIAAGAAAVGKPHRHAVGVFFTAGDPWVLGFTPQRRYAGYVNWNGLVEIDEALAPGDQVSRSSARPAGSGTSKKK
jgi:hypothetical protein